MLCSGDMSLYGSGSRHCFALHLMTSMWMDWGGSGQYAKLCMVYEPNPGLGFEFENSVVGGAVPKEYVPAVVKGTEGELLNGIRMGFPVVDVKASLKERFQIDSKGICKRLTINLHNLPVSVSIVYDFMTAVSLP